MKISDISVDISPIYPISVMFDTILAMTDISPIYRFWTNISWKYQVCDIHAHQFNFSVKYLRYIGIYRDISRIYRDI